MRIGIGCISYNRPKTLKLWKKQMDLYRPVDCIIHIAEDTDEDRRGVAARSNECLRALKDMDYIFLFNDDCFPVKHGWAEFFINASEESSQHHFLYLKETPTIKRLCKHGSWNNTFLKDKKTVIEDYHNCAGCFMFLTKEVVEKVGAFDERFGTYSFEHANYSKRINMAGLTPMGLYLCPQGAADYIYAMDLDFNRREEFQKQVDHNPSMMHEMHKLEGYIQEGFTIFSEEIKEIHRPL